MRRFHRGCASFINESRVFEARGNELKLHKSDKDHELEAGLQPSPRMSVAMLSATRSAASCTESRTRCTWPRSFAIMGSPSPSARARRAYEWRRSWIRTSESPARARLPAGDDPRVALCSRKTGEKRHRRGRQGDHPCPRLGIGDLKFLLTQRHVLPAKGEYLVLPAPGQHQQTDCRHGVIGAEQARQRAALIISRIKACETPVPEPMTTKAGPTVADLAKRYSKNTWRCAVSRAPPRRPGRWSTGTSCRPWEGCRSRG